MKETSLYDSIGFLIGLTARSMKSHFNKALKREGIELTINQLRVLKVLLHKDGMNQQEIADLLVLEKPGITRQVNLLEQKGYVKRMSDESDRRNNRIYLTTKTHRLHDRVNAIAVREKSALTKGLSQKELENFGEVCRQILSNSKKNNSDS